MHTVVVSWKAVDRASSGHPWLFASDVTDRGGAQPGDAVRVADPKGRTLGLAHYSAQSQITLRLFERGAFGEGLTAGDELSRELLDRRIAAAAAFRERVANGATAYRLIHAEADLLPGLIVDRYGDYLVVQALTQGMDRAIDTVVELLRSRFEPNGILLRNDAPVRDKEGLARGVRVAHGEIPGDLVLAMNGLTWHADLAGGQKTGLFLDQRENYVAVADMLAARPQRATALDCFTSTGGFALHMARACQSVEAVDSSAHALATAERNRVSNGIENVTFREADVFDLLAGHNAAKRSYDCVVLDPPAFAKSRHMVEAALKAYKEINLRALRLLNPGGMLVTCSCSFHVQEADLLGIVAQAALETGRTLRILDRRTQSADHPILLTVPETHYLKCLLFEAL